MADDPVSRQFVNGLVRLYALRIAAEGPTCGAEIAGGLARRGCPVGRGRLANALRLLERLGCLRSHVAMAGGRRRRYYRATPGGRKALEDTGRKLLEMAAEFFGEDTGSPRRGGHKGRER